MREILPFTSDSARAARKKPGRRGFERRSASSDPDVRTGERGGVTKPCLCAGLLRRLREAIRRSDRELARMAWKTDLMKSTMAEIDSQMGPMSKELADLQAVVAALEKDLEGSRLHKQRVCKNRNSLKTEHVSVTDRMIKGEQQHSQYLREREDVLQGLKDDLTHALAKNTRLADHYRRLWGFLVPTKREELVDLRAQCFSMEGCLQDSKQLKRLHSKMHCAQARYLRLRGQYNSRELLRLEGKSGGSWLLVEDVQNRMSDSVDEVTHFLHTEILYGKSAYEMAWEAVRRKLEQQQDGCVEESRQLEEE